MKIIKLVTVILFLFIATPSSAFETNMCDLSQPAESKTTIGYFNGLLNTEVSAIVRLAAARKYAFKEIPGNENFRYELYYNTTTIGGDFHELRMLLKAEANYTTGIDRMEILSPFNWEGVTSNVYSQAALGVTEGLLWFIGGFITRGTNIAVRHYLEEYIYKKLQTEIYTEIVESLNDKNSILIRDLNRQLAQISQQFRDRNKVFLMGHSQGGQFVNYIYDKSKDIFNNTFPVAEFPSARFEDSLKSIHIGSATRTVRGGNYILCNYDLMIKFAISNNPLIPNCKIPFPRPKPLRWVLRKGCGYEGDTRGHGFLETYLNPNLLKNCSPGEYDLPLQLLIDKSTKLISELIPPPAKTLEDGFIEVELSYIDNGLIALSVIEPPDSNQNVYFNDKNGEYGQIYVSQELTPDDPPNRLNKHIYRVNCEIAKMKGGVYKVGVVSYTSDLNIPMNLKVKNFKGELLKEIKNVKILDKNHKRTISSPYHLMDIILKWNYTDKKYEVIFENVRDSSP